MDKNKTALRRIALAAAKDISEQVTSPIALLQFVAYCSGSMHNCIMEGKIDREEFPELCDNPHYFFVHLLTGIVPALLEKSERQTELIADAFEVLYLSGFYEWYAEGMRAMMKMLDLLKDEGQFTENFEEIRWLYVIDRHLLIYHLENEKTH